MQEYSPYEDHEEELHYEDNHRRGVGNANQGKRRDQSYQSSSIDSNEESKTSEYLQNKNSNRN